MCLSAAAAMSLIGCGPENDPLVEYGPGPTDYDAVVPDDSMDTLYGVESVYFDDSDPVEQPDEIQTDYGPVSRSFLKK